MVLVDALKRSVGMQVHRAEQQGVVVQISFQTPGEFVLTVINIDGLTTARGDKDIVLAAVLKSGRQLQYATAEPEHGQ